LKNSSKNQKNNSKQNSNMIDYCNFKKGGAIVRRKSKTRANVLLCKNRRYGS
jgi:hypothetical protein